jgi:hypothetical protein
MPKHSKTPFYAGGGLPMSPSLRMSRAINDATSIGMEDGYYVFRYANQQQLRIAEGHLPTLSTQDEMNLHSRLARVGTALKHIPITASAPDVSPTHQPRKVLMKGR